MAGYSAHPQLDEQNSLGRHVRPQYVYRALRTDELLGNNSVRLEARGRVLPATPDTIKMAVEKGWGPSPFIHTTTSPTAALWFACSIKAQKKSGKIAKFDLKKFKGNVYDLSSQNRFLVPFSKADNFARCFSEVLLQGPHDFGSTVIDCGMAFSRRRRSKSVWCRFGMSQTCGFQIPRHFEPLKLSFPNSHRTLSSAFWAMWSDPTTQVVQTLAETHSEICFRTPPCQRQSHLLTRTRYFQSISPIS